VADSLAVARETLKGYREISDSVAQQVRDEVRQEVQKMDVAGLIGERISADFQRLEKSVGNMKINADALDKEISLSAVTSSRSTTRCGVTAGSGLLGLRLPLSY
jgi:4-hydroxy-3-methylbut-2-enyl diphosphate reductase IspH